MVRYAEDGKGITRWPIIEGSLTPTPAQPVHTRIQPIRSLLNPQEKSIMNNEDLAARMKALEQKMQNEPAPRNAGGTLVPADQHSTTFRSYMLRGTKTDLHEMPGSEGGILVPNTYSASIITPLEENSVMRRVGATIIGLEGTAAQKVPMITNTGPAQLTREEHDYNIDAPSLSELELRPYKYTRLTKVSEELLDDSRLDVLAQVIGPDAGRAFAQAENIAFITGNGASEPQGIMRGLAGANNVTSEASTAIKYDDVVNTFYQLPLSYRDRARWLVSDDASKALRKLKDGAGRPVWEPSMQIGQPDMLLGRPVVISAYLPKVASGNVPMVFGDFSFFWIAEFSGMAVQRLDELFAATGQIGFRWYRRMDSRVMLSEAFSYLTMK
jgi:HK97 family phage major capsid protein